MTPKIYRLREVALLNPRRVERLGPAEAISFLRMADLDAEIGATSEGEARPFGAVAKGYSQFEDGDILVAKITPCFENGKIAHARLGHRHGAGSTEFHVVRPDRTKVDDRYLLRFLRQPWVRLEGEGRMTGSVGQRRVPEGFLSELGIPLPSLEEQRQISNVLDLVDAVRLQRRRTIALLEHLAKSVFRDMFGDVVRNDQDWDDSSTLGGVAEVSSGITKGRRPPDVPTRPVPYMTVANVKDRALDLSLIKEMDVTEREVERYSLAAGDLLLTEGGDPDKLGRGTLWRNELPECIHQNHIFRVRMNPDGPVDPVFANWIIASQRGRRYFLRSAKQTTGIASINISQLRQFPMLLPPHRLQRKFADKLDKLDAQRSAQQSQLAQLDALYAAVQYRAFRGELWDEPAD